MALSKETLIKYIGFQAFILLCLQLFYGCSFKQREVKVLVFSKTAGFRHTSIGPAKEALIKLAKENNVVFDTTENANAFTEENLKNYSAVIFLSTTGDVLNSTQESCFQRFIQAGGGFVGIHAASDTEYGWGWYGHLVGAYFENHPEIQVAELKVLDKNHPSTKDLPDNWKRKDEWYNFKLKSLDTTVSRLINLNEASYKGGTMKDNHPWAWYHNYDGGRSFYTNGGHTDSSWVEPLFLKHVWGGITYAIGDNKLDYSKAYSPIPPDETRFTKKVLEIGLDEPMELGIDKDGNVFFVQRKGQVFRYDVQTKKTTQIAQLDVWSKHEDGLLGITLDPNFSRNGWLYLFYSPNGTISKQNISRFTYQNDTIGQERILLEVPTQRNECCHSGGSLTFDKYGNLWISLGDNTNPFRSDGYAPIDERSGRSDFDAQKSAANPHDLRGKILRIHPEPDGSYSIPKGNLFDKNPKAGRPEIYVMGCRNPYRISYDSRKDLLYWGDVGPDGGKDSTQGPRGYDEFNVATQPGFFGWPYFIGNNKPYSKVNFIDSSIGARFNPEKVENLSPNNYGSKVLPSPQPALWYYPYMESDEFPYLEKGGRCAMAGPTYYYDPLNTSSVKLPRFFDGRVIAYDWMRNWFFALEVSKTGKIVKKDRVFTGFPLNRVIDMEIAPDGSMYMLEYGTVWFAKNEDSRLIKIEYSEDNRAPVAKISSDISVGKVPLKVKFSSQGSYDSDPKDTLSFEWRITNPFTINSKKANPEFTFTKPGVYQVVLVVTDKQGKSASSELQIKVGNDPPKIWFDALGNGNKSFYFEGQPFPYRTTVVDFEDGTTLNGGIDANSIITTVSYLPQGTDLTEIAQGHQENKSFDLDPGSALIAGSDCKACHQPLVRSIGPAWGEIAERYQKDAGAELKLAKKVIKGGGGVWGDHGMSAHPQLSIDVAREMVKYILKQLPAQKQNLPTLPSSGTFIAKRQEKPNGLYVLQSTYKDKGAKGAPPIANTAVLILKNPKVEAETFTEAKNARKKRTAGNDPHYMEFNKPEGWFMLKDIDLNGISSFEIRYACEAEGGWIELHSDSVSGLLVGKVPLKPTGSWDKFEEFKNFQILNANSGLRKLFFVYKRDTEVPPKKNLGNVDYILFHKGRSAGLASR